MPSSVLSLLLLFLLSPLPTIESSANPEAQILLDLRDSLVSANSPPQVFESWAPTNSPCNFTGVACDSTGSVSGIDLSGRGISGTLPFDSLCQLPSLTTLSLGSNHLSGALTPSLRNCTFLAHLDLAFNYLTGTVPDLTPLNNLRVLNISDNLFSGPFPWNSLGNLTGLVILNLGDNGFARSPFPDVVRNLTKLTSLRLYEANIGGEFPNWIGELAELQDLELSDNFISGSIPAEIAKLTKLTQLELYNNSFSGTLPAGFGSLSELAFFDASMNNLQGNLSELRFLTNLVSLQLFQNNFSGEVPAEFGDFKYLVNLSLYTNQLSGSLPEKLGSWAEFNFIDVSTNMLTGPIPPDMCRRGTMLKLLMLENNFTGGIPPSYANCSTLQRFRVSNNSLSGAVPTGIWSLPQVNIIDLAGNWFEGPIGAGVGEAKSLNQLFLADNQFSGALPAEIGQASSLVGIDVSYNTLSGEIPATIGKLKGLITLNLQRNSISGAIPESVGSCTLNSLDLSDNQISGEIPGSLSALKLSSLNLSDNRLAGPLPAALSIAAYSSSFIGNPGLCADNKNAQFLPRCASSGGSRSHGKLRTVLAVLLATAALLVALLIFVVKRRSADHADGDRHRFVAKKDSWDMKSFRILSFDEQEIIDSVKRENLIGRGGSGNVYRAELSTGRVVAVKHILHSPCSAYAEENYGGATAILGAPRRMSSLRCREFEAEVGTLSSIRHVNVVKLYCSITSDGSSLLVYEHLPNGSLWDRLHTAAGEKLGTIDWDTRYEVAVGAARGLEYLHHGCDRPILHRDVKSSNILLDECFKPRIADFGLAKILHSTPNQESSTNVIAGTHGYIAPEYAYTCKVNEKSDVYSFGVVLMELVTGRKPIEAEYGESKDIVYWICESMDSREKVMGAVDKRIAEGWAREEAVKVLRVAVLCAARLPTMRPSMRTVVHMLEDAGSGRASDVAHAKDDK
uniref:Protein kinase domain-containing protein n=1 Tax=Ananas comosus var. bracteatus TaxID=296719 RepID=A0A6V7QE09_ANACO|nr:unnamed protein product [Ananas comosus var. bracteatus]